MGLIRDLVRGMSFRVKRRLHVRDDVDDVLMDQDKALMRVDAQNSAKQFDHVTRKRGLTQARPAEN